MEEEPIHNFPPQKPVEGINQYWRFLLCGKPNIYRRKRCLTPRYKRLRGNECVEKIPRKNIKIQREA